MNKDLLKKVNASYRKAEQRASHYFKVLHEQVNVQAYADTLTKDFQSWKHNHIQHSLLSYFSRKKGKPDPRNYQKYIQWLDHTGKLDHYLDRSISYIYMRDLGKSLHSFDTRNRINHVVENLKSQLTSPTGMNDEFFNMAGLYRKAQREGIESTMIWAINKLKSVSSMIPKEMDVAQAQRKIIKIIAGVLMHEIEEMNGVISQEERTKRLDHAIRLGFSYGLTYPFIDDLLDAKILSETEEKQYADLIRTALITGTVPALGKWSGKNRELISYIHMELNEAFQFIKSQQRLETRQQFFNQAYVFFHSQEVDRVKDLSNGNYTNEELYIPVILKSSSSRLIIRSLINAPEDDGFDERTFFYGIYNQLADDFADMYDDLKDGAVTPYTYYLTYHKERADLINPFELYWTVISHLIHQVYQSDKKACEIILNRAINGLKRYRERMGSQQYQEVMELFASSNESFTHLIQKMVRKADDVDFFDKLLRDQMIINLKKEQQEQTEFLHTIEEVRKQINDHLLISKAERDPLLKAPIIEAANYSLMGDGKRLRPIMTWFMGVREYGLNPSDIMPLLKSLEYMHTASLIFDDLPSQDNAPIRRGRPTLHKVYNIAVSELTGLYLTQKAIHEQASLEQFDSSIVLDLIRYSAKMTEDMCKGQAMDIGSKGKALTLEQLNSLCFYKTGIAFEAALIMPAILAHADEIEKDALKQYARHAGIAFQIKDDLLDVEGDGQVLGKPIGKDAENNHSTFVTILGVSEAKKVMWDHYCYAMETLQKIPRNTAFLKSLLNYIVNRNR
ncbi:geranylgeranyl pyrophosphate synthase [Cytobacillus eiseniae]|uniref:Geranylgeranyl pyrophosphate synthase n=1 Tax=Cytobacillus eiseniae TaxID=762947 RepID=A0ABS4RF12_9BACI|nr:polyprenyl synthetase family protein [Cytobacillus eiseniae]MBP2240971.1 geranylgeranyl pyrophosphate synthase [Cytobacillus eiseniae]